VKIIYEKMFEPEGGWLKKRKRVYLLSKPLIGKRREQTGSLIGSDENNLKFRLT